LTGVRRLGVALLACWWSCAAAAESVALRGEHQQILVDLLGGLPTRWVSLPGTGARDMTLLDPGDGGSRLRWDVPGDPAAAELLASLEYTAELADNTGTAVRLTSREAFRGMRLTHRYAVPATGHTLSASLQIPPGARLVLESGGAFVPQPLPGFARVYAAVEAVRVTVAGQTALGAASATIPSGQWVGIRNRFWAILLRPAIDVTADVHETGPDRPRLGIQPAGSASPLDVLLYAGPIERGTLAAVDPVLPGLLFASLWNWLRAICFGLHDLLERWHGVTGSYGGAILLLSLTVRCLMWPLTSVAERWQRQVDHIRRMLQPELDAVRRSFRGEEAHRRTLEVYRRHGVRPFFTLWSLAAVLIQIPIFIAAFDMLGEEFSLDGTPFLWIDDLARPDRLAALPAYVPFFGGYLNLLPFLMTGLTLLAVRVEGSGPQPGGHRGRLYTMAGAFFVVLYGFPAGMVLYWTANNGWHLAWRVLRLLAGRARQR
jgi:YidC/Oxa1 family membrane protein insertase